MNKKLEKALKTIKIKCHPNSNPNPLVDEALEVVEQALQELDDIKNSEPSEAMKDLDNMANQVFQVDDHFEFYYDKVKQHVLKAQENEKKFGCPLDIMVKAVKQATFKGLYFDTTDTDGFKRKDFIKCYLDYDGFTNRFFWNTGWNGDVWLSSHKKTWWLKDNKEE